MGFQDRLVMTAAWFIGEADITFRVYYLIVFLLTDPNILPQNGVKVKGASRLFLFLRVFTKGLDFLAPIWHNNLNGF